MIWEVGDIRRVLDPSMPARDQCLLLLHQRAGWISDTDLATWIEYSSAAMFRSRVLEPLHKERYLEYDRKAGQARLSPKGSKEVETRVLKSRAT
jgi:hypothetical protein